MDDEKIIKEISEDNGLIDKEDYERALEKLSIGKASRIRELKAKKEDQKKALAEEQKNAKPLIENKDIHGFAARCMNDPVIPISILLAVLALVVAALYFILPDVIYKSMGVTLDDVRSRQLESTIYDVYFNGYGFNIPAEINYYLPEDGSAKENVTYFNALVPNSVTSFITAVKGSYRSSDGELMTLTIYAEYENSDSYFNFLSAWFGSFFQSFYPGLSREEALDLSTQALGDIGGADSEFATRGNISYRVIMKKNESGNAIIELQFAPA